MTRDKKVESFRKQMAQSMAELEAIMKGSVNEAAVGWAKADKNVCPTKGEAEPGLQGVARR
jgi:hypothetical protein